MPESVESFKVAASIHAPNRYPMSESRKPQEAVCSKYSVAFVAAPDDLKVGISSNVLDGGLPINGLRHPPEGDSTGWYIWAGVELSDAPDFFVPLHVAQLREWCREVLPYLGLPPGWRFLLAGEHADVWEDPSLLYD